MDFWQTEKSAKINTQYAFSQCLKICYDNNSNFGNSYTSCLDGCGRAASTYPLAGDVYRSFEACEDEVNDIRTEPIPSESQGICDDLSQDYYRLKGCEQGVTIFYSAIAPHNSCEAIYDNANNILATPDSSRNNSSSIQTQDLSE